MKKHPMIFIIFICIFLSSSYSQQKAERKGTIKEEDGVEVIKNPREPDRIAGLPSQLELIEDLVIGKSKDNENYMFSSLRSVQVNDEGDIFVLDWKENLIKVYDKTGKHIRTFGKTGQGPGEFQSPSRMYMCSDGRILIMDRGNSRLGFYSKDGRCLQEQDTRELGSVLRTKPDSRGHIYGEISIPGEISTRELIEFDEHLDRIRTITTYKRKRAYRELALELPSLVFYVNASDELIWALNSDYRFHVIDAEGNLVRIIDKKYKPVKILKSEHNRIMKKYFGNQPPPPRFNVVIPDNYPAFEYFLCDEVGRLYARTYEEDGEERRRHDVFDNKGRYFVRFFLPKEELIFVVKKGMIYCLVPEDNEGIPIIKRYEMKWE